MKKHHFSLHIIGLIMTGIILGSAIIIFKESPNFVNKFGKEIGEVKKVPVVSPLENYTPEISTVKKNAAGDITKIVLNNSEIFSPEDSIFINEKIARPIKELTVDGKIYLSKLGVAFKEIVKNNSFFIEICRGSVCSKRLTILMPEVDGVSEETSATGASIIATPPVSTGTTNSGETILTATSFTADYRTNDDLKSFKKTIDGKYLGTLNKQDGYSPENGLLSYTNVFTGKEKEMIFETKITGKSLLTKGDMYLFNFDGKYTGIKYNLFDAGNRKARLYINDKIHTLNANFDINMSYIIRLELIGKSYTVSIHDTNNKDVFISKGTVDMPLSPETILTIGSRNGEDIWKGPIEFFRLSVK